MFLLCLPGYPTFEVNWTGPDSLRLSRTVAPTTRQEVNKAVHLSAALLILMTKSRSNCKAPRDKIAELMDSMCLQSNKFLSCYKAKRCRSIFETFGSCFLLYISFLIPIHLLLLLRHTVLLFCFLLYSRVSVFSIYIPITHCSRRCIFCRQLP